MPLPDWFYFNTQELVYSDSKFTNSNDIIFALSIMSQLPFPSPSKKEKCILHSGLFISPQHYNSNHVLNTALAAFSI